MKHRLYTKSVLPRIAVANTPEGTRLTVAGAGRRDLWQIIYYAFLAVVGLGGAAPFLMRRLDAGVRPSTSADSTNSPRLRSASRRDGIAPEASATFLFFKRHKCL